MSEIQPRGISARLTSVQLTLMNNSMFSSLVSLLPFFSRRTRTSNRLAPTRWPISDRRACSSVTEYTRLWQYCTISEKSSAKALTLTSVLGRLSGRSNMADLPRVKRVSIVVRLGLMWFEKRETEFTENAFRESLALKLHHFTLQAHAN